MEKNIYVRECFGNGNIKGEKLYEVHATCNCGGCVSRYMNIRGGLRNKATATTNDENRVSEIVNFLNGWACKDNGKGISIEYISFYSEEAKNAAAVR